MRTACKYVLTEVALSKVCFSHLSSFFIVAYVPYIHQPSWSDMTESRNDRKKRKHGLFLFINFISSILSFFSNISPFGKQLDMAELLWS